MAVAQIADDDFAVRLRGFGPLGILAILIILFSGNVFLGSIVLPLGGIFVLLWAHWSRTPLRELGYVRPNNRAATIALGVALGVVLKFVMKAIVMPLFGADPVNQRTTTSPGTQPRSPQLCGR